MNHRGGRRSGGSQQARQTWHLTIKGHHDINYRELEPMIGKIKHLFYCKEKGEENGTEHTHVGLQMDPDHCVFQATVITIFCRLLKIDRRNEVDATKHNNFNTVVGYHYGIGGKEACDPKPIWAKPIPPREVEDMVLKARRAAKKLRADGSLMSEDEIRAITNAELMQGDIADLVKSGRISFYKLQQIVRGKEIMDDESYVPVNSDAKPWWFTGKLRHIYIFGSTNMGKSTFLRALVEQMKIKIYKWGSKESFQNYRGEEYIVMEEFRKDKAPGTPYFTLTAADLNAMADGDYVGPKKFSKNGFKIHPNVKIIILAQNHPFLSLCLNNFGEKDNFDAFMSRFLVITEKDKFANWVLRKPEGLAVRDLYAQKSPNNDKLKLNIVDFDTFLKVKLNFNTRLELFHFVYGDQYRSNEDGLAQLADLYDSTESREDHRQGEGSLPGNNSIQQPDEEDQEEIHLPEENLQHEASSPELQGVRRVKRRTEEAIQAAYSQFKEEIVITESWRNTVFLEFLVEKPAKSKFNSETHYSSEIRISKEFLPVKPK